MRAFPPYMEPRHPRDAERNSGKGSVIRRGWCHVAPEDTWLAPLDADDSVGAKELFRLAALVTMSSDVITGRLVARFGQR